MIPKLIKSETEKSFDVKIEDVEKVLSENYYKEGSAQKSLEILKSLLAAVDKQKII